MANEKNEVFNINEWREEERLEVQELGDIDVSWERSSNEQTLKQPSVRVGEEEDLNAVFAETLAELADEERRGIKPKARQPKALPESAASVEESYMEEVYEELRRLAEQIQVRTEIRNGIEVSIPEFDEELYQQMKPLFDAVFSHIMRNRH